MQIDACFERVPYYSWSSVCPLWVRAVTVGQQTITQIQHPRVHVVYQCTLLLTSLSLSSLSTLHSPVSLGCSISQHPVISGQLLTDPN